MVDMVTTWEQFRQDWSDLQNFFVGGEVLPYRLPSPSLEDVVDTIRRDEKTRIVTGEKNKALVLKDIAAEFRALPVAEAVQAKVQMSHFDIGRFTGPGQLLAGLEEILQQWQDALSQHGFTWTRFYPILFLSGPHSYTNYHIDYSHVLAIQVAGTKRFCWLKDPERWCPRQIRRNVGIHEKVIKPEGLTADDVIEVDMGPGDVLWNTVLTPHWVYALDKTSYSINVAINDLRCDGQLSPMGIEVQEIMREREAAKAGA